LGLAISTRTETIGRRAKGCASAIPCAPAAPAAPSSPAAQPSSMASAQAGRAADAGDDGPPRSLILSVMLRLHDAFAPTRRRRRARSADRGPCGPALRPRAAGGHARSAAAILADMSAGDGTRARPVIPVLYEDALWGTIRLTGFPPIRLLTGKQLFGRLAPRNGLSAHFGHVLPCIGGMPLKKGNHRWPSFALQCGACDGRAVTPGAQRGMRNYAGSNRNLRPVPHHRTDCGGRRASRQEQPVPRPPIPPWRAGRPCDNPPPRDRGVQ